MTTNQNKAIYALFTQTGLIAQKENLVLGISSGRTASTKELTDVEATDLIKYLKSQDENEPKAEKMRRKIIAMAHELHWHKPRTHDVDMKRLDDWCKKNGFKHVALNSYTLKDLPTLVTQFEAVQKYYLEKI